MAPDKKDAEKPFNWDDYLKKTKGVKAPTELFSQPKVLPKNQFKVGQLILAKDNLAHLMVLCEIRAVYKCWIYIHILGLDDTHCRWVMCDDRDIEPVAPRNEKLKFDHRNAYPPTGLKPNFKKWIVQQYQDHEGDIAEASLFHPFEKPNSNQSLNAKAAKFEVGMKLAAYDDKSFDGNLSPATIVEVTKTTMKLNFDGWPSSYDITVPFTSRCIYPIDLIKGTDLTINAPRATATQDSGKGQRELRRTRNSSASGQIKKEDEGSPEPEESEEDEDEEEEEGEGGGPPSKRKRLGFFDAANKPMRPGQRAAAMKEQVTGVKAKVIDLLREATEAQEREESNGRSNQQPPKLVPMTKVVKVNTTPVSTVRQEPVRTIVPKPVVVYQSLDPTRQQVFHTIRPTVQQVRVIQNDGRVVTVARAPKTLVPGNTLARIVTVPITTSGDVIRADPNITSALRQSLLDDAVASKNIQKNGQTSSHTNTPKGSGPSATAVVTTSDTPPTLRRVFAQGDTVLVEHPKQVLRPMEPTSSRNHSNDSHVKASPKTVLPRTYEVARKAITVRPMMQSSSQHTPDTLPVRRIDPNQPLYTNTSLPRLSMNSPSILTHKKTIAPRPFPIHHKPPQREPSMPVLQPMASTSAQQQMHPEPKQQPIDNNNSFPTPTPAPTLTPTPTAPVKPVPIDVPPPAEKRVKVEEYKFETKTIHKEPKTADIKMYVSKHCKMGPLLCAEKVINLNDYPERPYPIQIQHVVQDLIYCAWIPREVFDRLDNLPPETPSLKVLIRHEHLYLSKNVPIHLSSVTALMWLRDFLVSINCCPNAISGSEFACENCAEVNNDVPRPMPKPFNRVLKYRREVEVLKKLGAKLPNVQEVSNEYLKRMGEDMAGLVMENQIDSAVLPYCQEDLLREQMQIPYNVALRMAAVALELRAQSFESVPGIETMSLDLK